MDTESFEYIEESEMGLSVPSWSVAVLIILPEGKTISRDITVEGNQLRKYPNGENVEQDGSSPRKTAVRVLKDSIGLDICISQLELIGKRIKKKDGQPHIMFMFKATVSNLDTVLSEQQKKTRKKTGFKLVDLKSVSNIPGFSEDSLNSIKIVHPRKLIIRKN